MGPSLVEMDRSSGTSLPNSLVIPGLTLELSVLQPLEQGVVGFPNPSVVPSCPRVLCRSLSPQKWQSVTWGEQFGVVLGALAQGRSTGLP